MSAETTKFELLAKNLRDLPDVLVSIQLDLKPLCEGKIDGIPDAAKKTLADACTLISESIARVMTTLEYIDEWAEGEADKTRPPYSVKNGDGEGKNTG